MNITIIGVGAMGCLFAAKLEAAAHVGMIGHWPAQLESLQRSGLTLEHPDGRFTHHNLHATEIPHGEPPADLALVLVKSWQTTQAAQVAANVLAPNGIALTLQNGLGNLEQLTAVLTPSRATLGVTSAGAAVIEPGRVRHAGYGQTYLAPGQTDGTLITQFAAMLNQVGFDVQVSKQVDSLVWGKLIVNAGINPLTALLHKPNGYLVQNELARQLMYAAANEAANVAQALNIKLPYANPAAQAEAVARATAVNLSSMLQDVRRDAPTEIEAICGAIVQNGHEQNVPTPINEKLVNLIKAKREQPINIEQLHRLLINEEDS
jgi:2-dehydropantoate 2-reductase